MITQEIRSSLFARAITARLNPRFSLMRLTHTLSGSFFSAALNRTALAPCTSMDLTYWLPHFDMLSKTCLPPVLNCRGTNPKAAEASLPRLNCLPSPIQLFIAWLTSGPNPRMANNLLHTVSCRTYFFLLSIIPFQLII